MSSLMTIKTETVHTIHLKIHRIIVNEIFNQFCNSILYIESGKYVFSG